MGGMVVVAAMQNTPLHPIVEWGRLRFGGADASDGQRLAEFENALRLVGLDAAEYAPLIALLIDVPLTEDRRARAFSAHIASYPAAAR